ncbi:hypothetical protein KFU94_47965 [Chloroflexi bacterium TSY]|nr:hypothetical protein [Chloroflexi bacterium TSY]
MSLDFFRKRTTIAGIITSMLVVALLISPTHLLFAQDGETMEGADDDVAPAPPSIGADVPLTYFGPAPSDVQKELIGPFQLLKAGQIDLDAGTISLPLYEGQMHDGTSIWYVVTDTTDEGNAAALGLNHSPKLAYSTVGNAARIAQLEKDGSLTFFRGTVDFSPEHSVTPGEMPNAFPPSDFSPGSIGDEEYSPLVYIENAGGAVYNAPIISMGTTEDDLDFCEGNVDYSILHDKVVSICPEEGTVTLALTPGFSFARPVLYLSLDANNPMAAAMEAVTLAPGLDDIAVGGDDSLFSAVERIFAFANGPIGNENPQRQGFNSALMGEGGPLNVLGGIPTIATDYSPLWDLNVGVWTEEAIENGYTSRLTEEFAILGMVELGWLTGPGGAPYGSTGIIVNCPIVWRFL